MLSLSEPVLNLFKDLLWQGFIAKCSDANPDFSPLQNKRDMVIANLMPVKLMVVESQWMILTALDKRGIYRVIPDKDSTQSIIIR